MRLPAATYRLQFHKDFGFTQAKDLVPYLQALGISDIYASPIFKARPGSMHGYDVVDPGQFNPELGSVEEFNSLSEELQQSGMGWLQDIVPNHMAYDGRNHMLMDVLENGSASPYFDYFDIDWNHPYESIRGRILAPFLGAFYGQCLENGEIQLKYDQAGLSIHYYALRLPLYIESYSNVFTQDLTDLRRRLGGRHPDFIKLLGVLYALKSLPPVEERKERADQIMFVKSMLWELYTTSSEVKDFIDGQVDRFNGRKGVPESFNPLDQLLSEQLFRLSFWKVATEEINYRRFFNINELISLRMEDEKVFRDTHSLIFKLIATGKVTGVRIDHIDGLYDPTQYLERVHRENPDLYLVVEKILNPAEELPSFWPVQGTTGYDFTNMINGIFCERKSEKKMTEIYVRFTGFQTLYPDLVSEKKRLIIGKHMAGDVDDLAHLLKGISSRDRFGGDITLYGLKRALVEVLTFFPVYRSYISHQVYREEDRLHIQAVIGKAKEANPALLYELGFIERFLLLEFKGHPAEEEKEQWVHFVMRLQQLTGPLMAKGFEDTTLYIYSRLLSLNEVGGDPGRFGVALEEFHQWNRKRAQYWPHSMNTTCTHDTKRGEDARARINVLSELPEEWERNIKSWNKINRGKKSLLKGQEVPDRNDEYFLYQTLIGSLPLDSDRHTDFLKRVQNYIIKAVREAKVHTEWVKPDIAYEEAYLAFIEAILAPSESNEFMSGFLPFARKIAHYGTFNSLSQTLLKIFSPGVPDFYRGTELWDLSFVDPDNRRPIDFSRRMRLLDELKQREREDPARLIEDLLKHKEDARVKLYLTYKALILHRERKELFQDGEYTPLFASGRTKEHVGAFARHKGDAWVVIAAPRLLTRLISPAELPLGEKVWGSSTLALPRQAPARWVNIFTGEIVQSSPATPRNTLRVSDLFSSFPVALLVPSAW